MSIMSSHIIETRCHLFLAPISDLSAKEDGPQCFCLQTANKFLTAKFASECMYL